MTRRATSIAAAILLAQTAVAPLAAQVGHTPETSPYEDLRGKQALTLSTGLLAPGGDPAGVGPRNALQLSARYELLLTGPLWLQARASYLPQVERTYKDPLATGAARILGISHRPMAMLEGGFGVNLTGNKSWNGLVPQWHGALGWVTGGTNQFDPGGYKFGNRFTISHGLALRVVTGGDWEWHADMTQLFWKYTYPEEYGPGSAAGTGALVPDGSLSPWKGNLMLHVGMSRFFFR